MATPLYPSLASVDDKIVLRLRWDHQFQFAGYYAAKWQGYYRENGLDVEIRSAFEPDGKYQSAITAVAEGRADFGTAGADLLAAVDQGRPLVVVASIFQRSPVAFYAKSETGLQGPADLTSLRVGVRPDGIASVELRAMLRAEGIDPAAVVLRPIQGNLGIDDVVDGVLDVASGFTISAGWLAKNHAVTLTALHPATYGVDFYGSALFTHQRWIDNNPSLVQRFVSASLKGWEYALTNAEEIADRISEELPRTIAVSDVRTYNRFQIKPVRALTYHKVVELGHSNPDRWRRMYTAMMDAGIVTRRFEPERLIFDPVRLARDRTRHTTMLIVLGLLAAILVISASWFWHFSRSRATHRRAEKALQANEQRLQLAEEHARRHLTELAHVLRVNSMGEMATALAHEINQPLTAIYNFSRGCLRRIESGSASPNELVGALTQVSEQAERASKVVRNLADFVRKGKPDRTETDVNEMVRLVVELARGELENTHVGVVLNLADGLPRIPIDRIEMEQVLFNLVHNSVEAMKEVPARRRSLTIVTAMSADDAIEIVVRDTGPGFADNILDHIFEPFFTTKSKGMGMGLAIGRTIVAAHRGRMWAAPNDEMGAAFHVTLPAQQGAEIDG